MKKQSKILLILSVIAGAITIPLSIPLFLIAMVSLCSSHGSAWEYIREFATIVYPILASFCITKSWIQYAGASYAKSAVYSSLTLAALGLLTAIGVNPVLSIWQCVEAFRRATAH